MNQKAISECERNNLCNSCRTDQRKKGRTKCTLCLQVDAINAKARRAA